MDGIFHYCHFGHCVLCVFVVFARLFAVLSLSLSLSIDISIFLLFFSSSLCVLFCVVDLPGQSLLWNVASRGQHALERLSFD